MTRPLPPEIPVRIAAPWLTAPSLRAVFSAFASAGSEVRVVGGAVRNAVLGIDVADIDLATPMLPDDVIALARKNDFSVYPTGLSHGTVTVVAHGVSFEITTLRRDVETTGRHAVVAFTSDWEADAQRRDFTINALFATADGTIIDCVGGLDDLAHRRVRFIGDPSARIREDYLRILRFFRFFACYDGGDIDPGGLKAATTLKSGLKTLSAERIRSELLALLRIERAGDTLAIMQDASIIATLFDRPFHLDRLNKLDELSALQGVAIDPLNRLAAAAVDTVADCEILSSTLRLSTAEYDALRDALRISEETFATGSSLDLRTQIYHHGNAAAVRALLWTWSRGQTSIRDPSWLKKLVVAQHWAAPSLPFSGRDVLAHGIAAGPQVGEILQRFERWWIAHDFPDDTLVLQAGLIRCIEQV